MFSALKKLSQHSGFWIFVMLGSFSLLLCALYFQYVQGFQPCVYCIYQRCALIGMMFAGIIGAIKPKSTFFRLVAFAIFLFSAYRGFTFAAKQVQMQFNPDPLSTCPLYPEFPSFLPLVDWLPSIFEATGTCGIRVWQFLGLEMSQWTLTIFASALLVGGLLLISQLATAKKDYFFK